jgi:hypothetical protein
MALLSPVPHSFGDKALVLGVTNAKLGITGNLQANISRMQMQSQQNISKLSPAM